VKRIAWVLVACSAWAQKSTVTPLNYDINGHLVAGVTSIQSNGSHSEITRNLNGRTVPVETVDEQVVSSSGSTKIIERTIKRFDPNGIAGPPERVRIEETKEPDGTVRTSTTVSRGDINGGFHLAERATKVAKTNGNRTEATTVIERPTLNGAMDTVGRDEQNITTAGPKTLESVTVFRKDTNGRMGETARKMREAVKTGDQENENTTEFESASTGQMKLMRQSTARIEPNGTREVNLYLPNPEGKLILAEQHVIEKRETPAGVTSKTTVRFALPSDPGKLGPARKAEEDVCTGVCGRPTQP
jgi:hypothetical protein